MGIGRVLLAWAGVAGCGAAHEAAPEGPPSAEELLRAARAAVLATPSVTYDYAFEAAGQFRTAPRVEGHTTLARGPDRAHGRLRVHTELRPPAGVPDEPPRVMDIASDGERLTAVDLAHDRWFEGDVAEGAHELIPNFGGNGLVAPFLEPDPFARELGPGVTLAVVGEETVGGLPCVRVRATFPDPGALVWSAAWALGKEDHLPRAGTEWFQRGDEQTRTDVRLADLRAGAPVDEALLSIPRPDGFAAESLATHLRVGAEAPGFELRATSGETVRLGDLRGRVVVLAFALTVDPGISHQVLSLLQEVHAAPAEAPTTVLAVDLPSMEPGDPTETWRTLGFGYPLLVEGQAVVDAWHVRLPGVTYVLDPAGRVSFVETAGQALTRERLREAIGAAAR